MHNKIKLSSNKGSGLGVILYGLTLLLVLIFVAINIVNSKVIENGYSSLRDAVQTASSGSVIHLLKNNREGATEAQKNIISGNGGEQPTYDIYLQLALGYLINRAEDTNTRKDTVVETGEINNFIKLDHQKVVNTTMSLLEDAVVRRKDGKKINDTDDFKIMMFFIEPYRTAAGEKFFNIIAYGNKDYINGNIQKELAVSFVKSTNKRDMKDVYEEVEKQISNIVNCKYDGMSANDKLSYNASTNFWINLNARGENNYSQLIREMETYPHYVIVVKDFALPTIFDGKNTNDDGAGVKSLFTSLSGDGRLSVPMCALNTGKIQRQSEDAGWSQRR